MLPQQDFAYSAAQDTPGLALAVSVFADRADLRAQLADDVTAAGLVLRVVGPVAELVEGSVHALGEIVLVDCTGTSGAMLAALARLDERAARSGAQLIVSTGVDGLDAVFGVCEYSQPQILVDPSRGERVIALGRVLAREPRLHVRELSEDDRLTLLRLTEQVAQISDRLERMGTRGLGPDGGAFRFQSPKGGYRGQGDAERRLVRQPRPPMPDPRFVRQIIRQRQARARFFDGELFADPAWDMLLDLTAARVEHKRVSVTSLCIASGVSPTTALRWIAQMTQAGLFERVEDEADRRRVFIALSDKAADAIARYFAEMGSEDLS